MLSGQEGIKPDVLPCKQEKDPTVHEQTAAMQRMDGTQLALLLPSITSACYTTKS